MEDIKKLHFPYYNLLGISFYLYAFIFAVFSISILPKDILMMAALVVFALSPLKASPYLYIFSLPWLYVAKFSFGLTLSLIQSLIFIVKIILSKDGIKMTRFELCYMFYFLFCGMINTIVYRSFTGISFVFYFIISSHFVHSYFEDKTKSQKQWELFLYSVVSSCLFATIYGVINNTALERWIHGMGYANQLYGTLGTTRFGIYLCIGLLYGLFYINKKNIRLIFLIAISVAVLSTISMTAMVLMVSVYLIYFFMNGEYKKASSILIILLLLFLVILNWNYISNISVIKPISLRVENITQQTALGDYESATSGRTELFESYMKQFNSSSVISKIFGSCSLAFDGIQYSHNSYVDMLLYCGIIGLVLTIILQIKRITYQKNSSNLKIYLLLKFIIIIPAATVSIFSAQFWQIWLYI